MNKIELHQTAIAILEAIDLAEVIKSGRLENLSHAVEFSLTEYKKMCIDSLKLSDRVIARLESRYAKHLKKMGI